jgi:beta-glucosidase
MHLNQKTKRTIVRLLALSLGGAAVLAAQPPAAGPRAAGRFAAHDAEARALVERMTLDEKIGQMTQADLGSLDESDVDGLFLGSVLSGGDSDPPSNTVAGWRAVYERLQSRAQRTRLRIPLLYGVDAVHGHNNVVGATIFPHNIGLGATRNAALVEQIGRATAVEMRATGPHWTFAPAVSVVRDERWGRSYEGFSEDPALVAELGAAAVRGLQGGDLAGRESVLACAKHYVGDGGTAWDTGPTLGTPVVRYPLDQGDTRLDEAELRRIHMPGYLAALREGVGSIMVSFSSWNGQKLSANKRLLTEVLKDELGFDGFLVSDWNALDALPGSYDDKVSAAVEAGIDMFMVPQKHRLFIASLRELVKGGKVSQARVDDAVTRILRVKLAMGLLVPDWQGQAERSLEPRFGSREHRELARQAVKQSLVLLKNKGGALPLSTRAKHIHVAGKNADDLGSQCGGWTISWQGRKGPITSGTTILGAILQTASTATNITYSRDGSGAKGAEAGIVVVGETPYAEFHGDRRELSLDKEDLQAIANVKAAGIPVIVVLVSGRPMILGEALDQADAFLAAWLPGSEGQGVADVLFGEYNPTGKLPFTWPRSLDQIPINRGDGRPDPLFPFGFGLTY